MKWNNDRFSIFEFLKTQIYYNVFIRFMSVGFYAAGNDKNCHNFNEYLFFDYFVEIIYIMQKKFTIKIQTIGIVIMFIYWTNCDCVLKIFEIVFNVKINIKINKWFNNENKIFKKRNDRDKIFEKHINWNNVRILWGSIIMCKSYGTKVNENSTLWGAVALVASVA